MDCQELHEIDGLHFMPVRASKKPFLNGWQTSTEKVSLLGCEGVGLVCGAISGGLEVIDIDAKYSLDGKLFDDYKRVIHSADPSLLNKLVVQKTKGGGYHFLYRCSKISGNLKLANRPTIDSERQETYDLTYEKLIKDGKDDADARKAAQKAKDNDKVRVLLETRGQGGFIMCFPSQGYEFIYGDFFSITEITENEREVLHTCAMSMNTYVEEYQAPKHTPVKIKGKSPFEDYDERGDVIGLLENNGWRVVGNKGGKTIFLRPGATTAASSGNFDRNKNWFSVFTTSTEFEPQKAYRPYAVYATLVCNKNFSEASKRLFDEGYGEKPEPKEKAPSTRVIQSRINVDDDDLSFLAKPEDYEEYLQQVIDGTLPMGLTTGIPSLDCHFLFKQGNLVMINGIDNVGKSVVIWYLLLLAAMYHGWRGIIFSSENTLGSFMKKMIQFYWGKPLRGEYAMNSSQYKTAKNFIERHFTLIKAQEELYNYKDIINMVKKTQRTGSYQYGLIDPYNSLKIDLSGFSKLSTHEYHYEAASEIKAQGQQNKFGWFINMHATTGAARTKDGDRKYPVAPQKADTEGGQKFPNKTDDFLTIHRLAQHPLEWMVTEIHVRKIKETDTGGQVTPFDQPVKLEMYKGGTAFKERLEMGGNPVDPVQQWHLQMGTYHQEQIPFTFNYRDPTEPALSENGELDF